jgi:hypothetical protein
MGTGERCSQRKQGTDYCLFKALSEIGVKRPESTVSLTSNGERILTST